jgi:hypothetical protein
MHRSSDRVSFTSLEFYNYKAFNRFTLRLQSTNILVGPNNCGKSTIIGIFRLLEIGLRRARARNPEFVPGPLGERRGHAISSEDLPISLENVHNEYSDEDSRVDFRLSNGNSLTLYFPRGGGCFLLFDTHGRAVFNTSSFRSAFPVTISLVPVLGPVEHDERILEESTVRADLGTHRASRHFRNYWYHFPEGFEDFSELVRKTWTKMDIVKPEADFMSRRLSMFCLENRITRELFWAGFGFQIWCQLLTHISRAKEHSLFVVDEPEVYLHPDVQRQLLGILRDIGPDVLLATHSTEIIGDADPSEIVLIDKAKRSAQRLRDVDGIQNVLEKIGSIQNVTLTRLARNKRILFVEDEGDFKILRRFARQIGLEDLASGSDLTAVRSEGFSSWERVVATGWGLGKTLGSVLLLGAVYDRDYFCDEQISSTLDELLKHLALAHIHSRKELENYLLVPEVLERAIESAVADKQKRTNEPAPDREPMDVVLRRITDPERNSSLGQYIAKRTEFLRHTGKNQATLASETSDQFDRKWNTLDKRMEIVHGKNTLAAVRKYIQDKFGVSLTDHRIIAAFTPEEIPQDLVALLKSLDAYRTKQPNS